MVSRSKRRIQVSLIEQLKHIVLLLGAVRTSKQVAAGGRGAQHVFSPLLAHFALHGLKTVYRCASLLLQTCTAIIICWWCCMRSSGCHKVSIVNILHAGSSINVPFCRPASDLCTGRGAECWKKKKRSEIPRPSSLQAVNVLFTLQGNNLSLALSLSVSAGCWPLENKPHNHYFAWAGQHKQLLLQTKHTIQQQHNERFQKEKKSRDLRVAS